MELPISYNRIHKGFTLLELLIVMAIIIALLGISFEAISAIRESQYVVIQTQNVLESLQRARSLAIDSQTQSASDPWYYGYIFFLNNQGNSRGYCIDKWFATGANTDPTKLGFVPPQTLSQQVYQGTNPSIDPSQLQCSGYANTTGAGGYAVVDDKVYDSRVNTITYTYLQVSTVVDVKYIVFENITGKVFAFSSTGQYVPNASGKLYLQIADTSTPQTQKTIVLAAPSNEPPFIR